jgi:hypothetical protein
MFMHSCQHLLQTSLASIYILSYITPLLVSCYAPRPRGTLSYLTLKGGAKAAAASTIACSTHRRLSAMSWRTRKDTVKYTVYTHSHRQFLRLTEREKEIESQKDKLTGRKAGRQGGGQHTEDNILHTTLACFDLRILTHSLLLQRRIAAAIRRDGIHELSERKTK